MHTPLQRLRTARLRAPACIGWCCLQWLLLPAVAAVACSGCCCLQWLLLPAVCLRCQQRAPALLSAHGPPPSPAALLLLPPSYVLDFWLRRGRLQSPADVEAQQDEAGRQAVLNLACDIERNILIIETTKLAAARSRQQGSSFAEATEV